MSWGRGADYPDGLFYLCTCAAVGNRLAAADQYSTINYAYDYANQLTSASNGETSAGTSAEAAAAASRAILPLFSLTIYTMPL